MGTSVYRICIVSLLLVAKALSQPVCTAAPFSASVGLAVCVEIASLSKTPCHNSGAYSCKAFRIYPPMTRAMLGHEVANFQ